MSAFLTVTSDCTSESFGLFFGFDCFLKVAIRGSEAASIY